MQNYPRFAPQLVYSVPYFAEIWPWNPTLKRPKPIKTGSRIIHRYCLGVILDTNLAMTPITTLPTKVQSFALSVFALPWVERWLPLPLGFSSRLRTPPLPVTHARLATSLHTG